MMFYSLWHILHVSQLLLAPQLIGKTAIGVVDAHTASEIRLGVLDALQLVGAQLQDAFALLTLPQLGRDHWHARPMMMITDGGRAARGAEHV